MAACIIAVDLGEYRDCRDIFTCIIRLGNCVATTCLAVGTKSVFFLV